jgi:hypothetical protein
MSVTLLCWLWTGDVHIKILLFPLKKYKTLTTVDSISINVQIICNLALIFKRLVDSQVFGSDFAWFSFLNESGIL